ncbi:MAG TPA: transporter [Vicinamibacterales bacterium]|nr:transporter [Vicinamibacterales bacterium]
MTHRLVRIALAVLLAAASRAEAQSVTSVLTFLLENQSVQTGSPARDQASTQATTETIARALLANLATLPVPTSSSAFSYQLNPELGTVERSTQNFGPFFVERAQTAGRGQSSFGMTFEQMHFTSLDGHNLRDGTFVTTANQFVDEQTPFDVDQLTLNIDASIATVYGNVGITDRFEIGAAVPFVRLKLDGSRVDNYRGRNFTQATASAESTGLADIIVRGKYTLYSSRSGDGAAAAVDVRLPTGQQDDLLGAGTPSVKVSGIGSINRGPVAVHVNAGVSVGGLATEVDYAAAVELAATPRATFVAELLGRTLDSPGHIIEVSAPNPTIAGVQTLRLAPDTSMLNIITLVPGFKWNVSATWVLAANVSIPLTAGGLTAPFTPFVGLDYSLGH